MEDRPPLHVQFPVDGRLDTVNPATNRPPGTLVEAPDLAHRWIGPRRCLTQQTWPFEALAASRPNPRVPVFDGTDSQMVGTMRSPDQYQLPVSWTLDLVVRPSSVTHSADAALSIFNWDLTAFDAFDVQILGGGSAAGDQRKIRAIVKTTSSPATVSATVTVTGTTQVTVGTNLYNTHHIRLVRDVKNLTLYVDGVTEASSTSLDTNPSEAATAVTTTAAARLADGTTGGNHLYAGRVLSAVLRVGAATDVTRGMRDFAFPHASSTKLALYGEGGTTTTTQWYESSPWNVVFTHPSVTTEEVTEPAPWHLPGIQGAAQFVDFYGTSWNVVSSGGFLYWDQKGTS